MFGIKLIFTEPTLFALKEVLLNVFTSKHHIVFLSASSPTSFLVAIPFTGLR